MKKIILTLFFVATSLSTFSQIGVGTTDPKTTLDVVGDAAAADKADGVLTPRLTGDELRAKTAYTSEHTGALVYVTAADSAPTGATANVTAAGYYFFDGN